MCLEALLNLLAELVGIDTVNDPVRGKRVGVKEGLEVARIIREHTGYKMSVVEHEGVPTLLWQAGSGRPVSLFLAHFDTVPPGPGWTRDPFALTVEGDRAYGRGAADDKSNVAAIAHSVLGFEPRRGTVIVAFTGDEEVGGLLGAGFLAGMLRDRGLTPDYLINGDGSLSRVIVRRRSALSATVSVREEPGSARGCRVTREAEAVMRVRNTMHSAYFIPGVDSHPLIEAALWLRDRELEASRLEGEWVKGNVIPRRARLEAVDPHCRGGAGEAGVDRGLTALLRALIPLTRAAIPVDAYSDYGVTINPNVYRHEGGWHSVILDIRAMIRSPEKAEKILGEVLEESIGGRYRYKISVSGGRGYLYTPVDSYIVRVALDVAVSLGLPGEPVEAGGASDSRYFSPAGVEAIDFGPLGGGIHGPDEYVAIPHLVKAARFYKELVEKIHG